MFGKTEKTYENFKDVMFLDAFFRPDEKMTCKFGKNTMPTLGNQSWASRHPLAVLLSRDLHVCPVNTTSSRVSYNLDAICIPNR